MSEYPRFCESVGRVTGCVLTLVFCSSVLAAGPTTVAEDVIQSTNTTTAPDSTGDPRFTGLTGGDAEINAAVDRVLADRRRLVAELITYVDPANAKKYSEKTRAAAGLLLGQLRAVEAVPVLARALEDEPGEVSRIETQYNFAFSFALRAIGRPSVPAMVENIKVSDSPRLRRMSSQVIWGVLGSKQAALNLLKKVAARSKDTDEVRRMEAAIKLLEGFQEIEEPLY